MLLPLAMPSEAYVAACAAEGYAGSAIKKLPNRIVAEADVLP